jgi:hypothetical protein
VVSIVEFLTGLAGGLMVNECSDISPWLAHKIVRWSAWHHHDGDPERVTLRADELHDLVERQPAKLTKLAVAVGIGAAVAGRAVGRQSLRLVRVMRTAVSSDDIAVSFLRHLMTDDVLIVGLGVFRVVLIVVFVAVNVGDLVGGAPAVWMPTGMS